MSVYAALMLTIPIMLVAITAAWLVTTASESLSADTRRVEAARIALTEHRTAVRHLLGSDALDDEWRAFIIDFSAGVLSRDVARFIAEIVERHVAGTLEPDPLADQYRDRLAELARQAPDTHELMAVATRSGLVAALLQWPETTAATVRIAVESEAQSVGTAVRARQKAAMLAPHFVEMPIAA